MDGCASHGHRGRADSLGDCSEYCGISLTDVSPCVSPMLLSRLLGHLRLGIMNNVEYMALAVHVLEHVDAFGRGSFCLCSLPNCPNFPKQEA